MLCKQWIKIGRGPLVLLAFMSGMAMCACSVVVVVILVVRERLVIIGADMLTLL